MPCFSFPKSKRLVSNRQFKAILNRNLRFSNGLLILYLAENGYPYWRVGISVGKSCGNAVKRNRLKRLLREAFRQSQQQIPDGFDYLIMIASRSFEPAEKQAYVKTAITFDDVKNSLIKLINKAIKGGRSNTERDSK